MLTTKTGLSFRIPEERFLDDLVVEIADLESLNKISKEDRPKLFLEEIGYVPKSEYIRQTITNDKFPFKKAISNGILYVFTPDEGFGYKKDSDSVQDLEEIPTAFDFDTTVDGVIRHLVNLSKCNGMQTY